MTYGYEFYEYYLFSQLWLPTVQDVLHADWHEVWHSPQPPLTTVLFKVLLVKVLILFMSFASYIFIYQWAIPRLGFVKNAAVNTCV